MRATTRYLRPFGAAISLFLLGAAAAAGQVLPKEFRRLAEAAVPSEVGTPALTARLLGGLPGGPQLSAAFDPRAALQGLGDSLPLPEDCACAPPLPGEGHSGRLPDDWTATSADGSSVLQASLGRGKVTYLNRNRSYQATRGVEIGLSNEAAQQIALAAAAALGVPAAEIDRGRLDVQTLVAAARDRDGLRPTTRLRAELHVRARRVIAGTPVFDSFYQAAVSAGGLVARLHLQWPDFALAPGLSREQTLTRRQVVARVAAELEDGALPGSWRAAAAEIVYARVQDVGSVGEDADEGEAAAPAAFVPALAVYALPREPAENSGRVASAGRQFLVPLMAANPDPRNFFCRSGDALERWAFSSRERDGGEGGIRTHGPVARSTVFETAPFDRSGTSPGVSRSFSDAWRRGWDSNPR